MVTAAMIAMFYVGTASGVMGAVLVSTSRNRDAVTVPSREDALPARDELRSAA